MTRVLAQFWFSVVIWSTGMLPELRPFLRLRGWLTRPCFRRCGRNLQLGARVNISYPVNVSFGDDVYIAYGSWVQGYGHVTFEDLAMLGPYTVIASTNHTKEDGAYRFGETSPAPILLKRGCWTGAHVTITAGVTIGAGACCAAGAVVTKDIPDHAFAAGVPARVVHVDDGAAETSDQSRRSSG